MRSRSEWFVSGRLPEPSVPQVQIARVALHAPRRCSARGSKRTSTGSSSLAWAAGSVQVCDRPTRHRRRCSLGLRGRLRALRCIHPPSSAPDRLSSFAVMTRRFLPLAFALALPLNGCATITSLESGSDSSKVYGGLRQDLEGIDSFQVPPIGMCGGWLVPLLDLPSCLVLDTALLPVTLVWDACRGGSQSAPGREGGSK